MNKSIKVGLIGNGFIGKIHTLAYNSMANCYNDNFSIELYKLLTSRKDDNKFFSLTVSDIKDLKDTDFLDICSPNFMHNNEILSAIDLGIKNIYSEKPLIGLYEKEVELCNTIKDKNINLSIAFNYRFLPAVIRAKKIIEDGIIGDIINFNAHLYHESYLDMNKPIAWRLDANKSYGGALIDLGIHVIDLMNYLLGTLNYKDSFVNNFINKRFNGTKELDVKVDDFAHIDLLSDKNFFGTVEVSRIAASKGEDLSIEIFGTKGYIKISNSNAEDCTVYIFNEKCYTKGINFSSKELEEDINFLWPNYKYSLGLMVNSHMASIRCFLCSMLNIKLNHISSPSIYDSLNAMNIINEAYKNSTLSIK